MNWLTWSLLSAGFAGVEVAPGVKQVRAKAGLANRLEELLGNDRVGVDVLAVHGRNQTFVEREFLHRVGSREGA